MRQILTCLILIGLLCTGDLYATDNGKKETIRRLRQEFARHISGTPVTNYTLAESLSLIDGSSPFTPRYESAITCNRSKQSRVRLLIWIQCAMLVPAA